MLDADEHPDIDLSALGMGTVVADVVIAPRPTSLLVDASRRGLATVGGAEMLVKQAAISFELWAARRADERVLREALDQALL
jgi:shikimate dehydrogenase